MRRFGHLAALLGLVLVGACGTGDPSAPADGTEDRPAALAPEADAETRIDEQAEEAPPSARFRLGEHYRRLSPTQPTSSDPERVEVAEIFWYGCPHCYELEPHIAEWAASKPDSISFVRIPATWNPQVRLHARAFYTAEALGVRDEMHDAFFDEIHRNRNPLATRDALAELFGRFGVEREAFDGAFDSYDVHAKVRRAEELGRRYRITGVPSIVINGKYVSDAELAGGYERLVELIDELATAE